MKRLSALCLALLLILALAVPAWTAAAQGPQPFPPEIEAVLQRSMDVHTAAGLPPGMVVWIDSPEYRYAGASGYADRAAEVAMQQGDAFRIGSITKMFTATIMLQLAEEDVLALDDRLADWLPEVAARLPHGDQITLRQLLNHTSGVFSLTDSPQYFQNITDNATIDPVAQTVALPCVALDPVSSLENYVYSHPASFEPGARGRWAYSNTGYLLLGMVIEAATGDSYPAVVRARILDPLAMNDTFLDCYEPAAVAVAHGYTGPPDLSYDVTGLHESPAWAAGGLVSTAPDLITFARALFAGELFRNPATLETMTTRVAVPDVNYGLGVMVEGRAVFGHYGGIAGYATSLQYFAASDIVTVILFNSDSTDPAALEYELLNTIRPLLQD